jgi:hypothetical protein
MKNMFKKFVILLASLGLIVQLSGCTSKDSKDDGQEMAIDGTEPVAESADVEKVEGEQNLDIAADDSANALSADALPEEALGEAPPAAASKDATADPMAQSAPPPDVAITDPTTDALPPDTLGDSNAVAEAAPSVSTPPVEESVMKESSAQSVAAADEKPKADPKPLPSYRKVDQTPTKEGGKLLNTVYVARSGDTWSSVNKAIYGNGKAAGLKKMNPAIKSRALKVGDKVYYNSPHRPDDDSKVLTFYEDSGLAPEVYIAKSGDNIKDVAKQLLGSKENWKELYATNEFESKGALDEGTQIKYWKSAPPAPKELATNSAATTAASETPAAPTTPDPATDPAAMAQVPPAPSAGEAAPAVPPPPAGEQHVAGQDVPPPPPPDVAEMAPPPPPPPPPPPHADAPPAKAGSEEAAAPANPMEDDQMTTLAAGAVLAVGLALFMIMRRRRKKELEQAIQDTHVG